MPSLYYADNTPAYYTSRPPAYQEIAFEIVAQGEVEHTAPDDICDPTRQTMFVRVHALRGDDGGRCICLSLRYMRRPWLFAHHKRFCTHRIPYCICCRNLCSRRGPSDPSCSNHKQGKHAQEDLQEPF